MPNQPPLDPNEDLYRTLAQSGLTQEQIAQLAPQVSQGMQMMQPQFAQGAHVGNTYVAASPWEHLANALRPVIGGLIAGRARDKQQELLKQQREARTGAFQSLQTAISGGQGGTLGTPGGGTPYDQFAGATPNGGGPTRSPDPQAAQALMTAMAGSGDSALQAGAHYGMQQQNLARQQSVLENTLRHQQVLEGQGQGRLDQGQERIDQGDDKVELLRQRLAQGLVKWNSNTGQFENVGSLVKQPRKSVLPGATGATTPTGAPTTADGSTGPAPLGKWQDKALKELGNDFNPSSGRSGEFGKNQARLNAAQRLLALAQDPKTGGPADLTPQQMTEVSTALATLIGGGSSGEGTRSELTPHTKGRSIAQMLQWVTDDPHGAGQQAFVQQMIDTAKREQGVAQQGVDQVRSQLVAKHQRILRSNPEESRKVLQGFGWDLDANGQPVQQQAPAAKPDTAALRKKYGL